MNLKRTTTHDADYRSLVELLDKDLWRRYPETQQFFSTFNKMKLDAKVVIAYEDSQPVGCGCFRMTDDQGVVEIKRMYVKDEARGKGIAKLILQELELWAKEEGNHLAILETGTNQPEAIGLYKKVGYLQIENYGPYIGIEASVCMSKDLNT